jgi:hypothetical protein
MENDEHTQTNGTEIVPEVSKNNSAISDEQDPKLELVIIFV